MTVTVKGHVGVQARIDEIITEHLPEISSPYDHLMLISLQRNVAEFSADALKPVSTAVYPEWFVELIWLCSKRPQRVTFGDNCSVVRWRNV